MSQPDRIEFITELVTPLAASLGLAVWGVELGGAARPIARIYVDVLPGAEPAPSEKASDDDLLPQGVTIDQCAELSRLAGDVYKRQTLEAAMVMTSPVRGLRP